MKIQTLILLLTLTPAFSFAQTAAQDGASDLFTLQTLKKGDFAKYTGTSTTMGVSLPVWATTEVVDTNVARAEITLKHDYTIFGITDSYQETLKQNELMDEAEIADILADCQKKGTTERVKVKAGTFSTCAIPIDPKDPSSGTQWIGRVPFGIVKYTEKQSDGTLSLELDHFGP